jgi:hypothetical protein
VLLLLHLTQNNYEKGIIFMSSKKPYTMGRFVKDSLPMLAAIFLAIASVVYVMFKSWSNKLDFERWKDYEDCGI